MTWKYCRDAQSEFLECRWAFIRNDPRNNIVIALIIHEGKERSQFGRAYAGCVHIPGNIVHSRTYDLCAKTQRTIGAGFLRIRPPNWPPAPFSLLRSIFLHVRGLFLERKTLRSLSRSSYPPTSRMWFSNVTNTGLSHVFRNVRVQTAEMAEQLIRGSSRRIALPYFRISQVFKVKININFFFFTQWKFDATETKKFDVKEIINRRSLQCVCKSI